MKRVGLTGGIATGKSHVRNEFEKLGIPTLDADRLAHDAVSPGTPELAAVVARFGPGVLDRKGVLDRRKLGEIVFADAAARRDLEGIIHPAVRAATDAWFESLDARHRVAIADVPLLYEASREADFDVVIATCCELDTQIRRVMDRDSLTEAQVRLRLKAQLPADEKARRANYVIRTDGTYEDTNRQVRQVLAKLLEQQ